MSTRTRATIEDLYLEEGKAELVGGEIVRFMPTGWESGRASSNIYLRLRDHERSDKSGVAVADNTGFLVDLPHRESFSPDAAWYRGKPVGMKFLEGAPVFAVEVRSEYDYGATAERAMAEKRRDCFAAGTLVVWDVDLLGEEVVRSYRAAEPEKPGVYRRGEVADAEPAVPGWTMPVDELFL